MQNTENQTGTGGSAPAPQPAAPPAMARSPWAYPVMWMVIVLLLVGAGLYIFKSCLNLPGQTFDKAAKLTVQLGSQLEKVAAAFKQGTITTTFTSYATTLSGSQYFQFAEIKQQEVFTRKDESSMAYGYIPLPDVIVEANAPVTYTYYLDLNDKWDFLLENGAISVIAPDIRFNKPAVDVSRITWEVKKGGYYLRDEKGAMENLKSSITWLSYKKAQANVDLVRETGRKQTETFVRNWLSKAFADGKNYPVTVHFRSELKTNGIVVRPRSG